jgi:hypothetical protein
VGKHFSQFSQPVEMWSFPSTAAPEDASASFVLTAASSILTKGYGILKQVDASTAWIFE